MSLCGTDIGGAPSPTTVPAPVKQLSPCAGCLWVSGIFLINAKLILFPPAPGLFLEGTVLISSWKV